MDIREYNGQAWDHEVERGNKWTVPVSPEAVAAARGGEWSIVLTPTRPVPGEWFGDLKGKRVLCLASGYRPPAPELIASAVNETRHGVRPARRPAGSAWLAPLRRPAGLRSEVGVTWKPV